jgi:hypothetical protein
MSAPCRHIGRTKVQLLPFILASRCWREVNLTSLLLYYREKPQYPLNTRLGSPHTHSGRFLDGAHRIRGLVGPTATQAVFH